MATTRPTQDPQLFATNTNYSAPGETWDATPTKVNPTTYRASGFVPELRLAAQYLNYIANQDSAWLDYFREWDDVLQFDGTHTFAGDVTFTGTHRGSESYSPARIEIDWNAGDLNVNSGGDINVNSGGRIIVSTGGSIDGIGSPTLTGSWTISGNNTHTGTNQISGTLNGAPGVISGTWSGSPIYTGNPQFQGTSTYTAAGAINGLSGAAIAGSWIVAGTLTCAGGRIANDSYQITTDANVTLSLSNGVDFWVDDSTLTAARNWTLPTANQIEGDTISVFSAETTHAITILGDTAVAGTVTIGGSVASGTRLGVTYKYCTGLGWYPVGEFKKP